MKNDNGNLTKSFGKKEVLLQNRIEMALATGFEPVIFSVTGRRVRPGYTKRASILRPPKNQERSPPSADEHGFLGKAGIE
jgi:hypothetical protein